METKTNLSTKARGLPGLHISVLVVLRLAVGWHLLYEGAVKLFNPDWTSMAFLAETKWLFSDVFHAAARNEAALAVVDFVNIWGLILMGLCLFFGLFSRLASLGGVALLSLYYVANPPIGGLSNGMGAQGNYLVVNAVLVEILALLVLASVPTGRFFGLDAMVAEFRDRRKKQKKTPAEPAAAASSALAFDMDLPRRGVLKHMATFPLFGGFICAYMAKKGWETYEATHLKTEMGKEVDGVSSATIKTFQFSRLSELKGELPKAKIGDLQLSRVILGGNLIGGWAHARDLIYANKLVKAYHTDRKIFDTFRLAEACGVNTVLTNPQLCRVINKYWRTQKGNIQFISDCGHKGDAMKGAEMSVDGGAHACYIQGAICEKLVEKGEMDTFRKFLEYVRGQGLPAGIGGHKLEAIQACVDAGIKPDFWVKTLHQTNYWSATEPGDKEKDNIWCRRPEETIAYMETLEEPWIAFKTLAAGALQPKKAFPYAFKSGADFICVGMYDFQIVDDVNIAFDALADGKIQNRARPWRA